jgi:7,8-dihydroneopterin aldolase/epimerase/oxygenase
MDRIEIRGLRAWGHHGVFEDEQEFGQTFVVDISLRRDLSVPAATDSLTDTIDYGAFAEQVAEAVEKTRFELLEALAAHIAGLALQDQTVRAVDVRVAKPDVTLAVDVDEVAIGLYRERGPARPPEVPLGEPYQVGPA